MYKCKKDGLEISQIQYNNTLFKYGVALCNFHEDLRKVEKEPLFHYGSCIKGCGHEAPQTASKATTNPEEISSSLVVKPPQTDKTTEWEKDFDKEFGGWKNYRKGYEEGFEVASKQKRVIQKLYLKEVQALDVYRGKLIKKIEERLDEAIYNNMDISDIRDEILTLIEREKV